MKKTTLTLFTALLLAGSAYAQQKDVQTIGFEKVNTDVSLASISKNYIDAIGGQAAIDKVKSIEFTAEGVMGGMPLNISIIRTNTGKEATTIKVNGNTVQKIVWDGNQGYIEMQGKKNPIPEAAKAQIKKLSQNGLFPEEQFTQNNTYKLEGTEVINGEKSYKVVGENMTFYYSIKTGLKTGQTIKQEVNGQTMVVPTTYSNYKAVDGIKFPFSFSQKLMGQEVQYTIKDYKINQATPEDFK